MEFMQFVLAVAVVVLAVAVVVLAVAVITVPFTVVFGRHFGKLEVYEPEPIFVELLMAKPRDKKYLYIFF